MGALKGLKLSQEGLGEVGGLLGCSWGVLGTLWAPNPNKSEGTLRRSWRVLGALEGVLEGVLASLGASWACFNNKLEKDSIFEVSKMVFQSF